MDTYNVTEHANRLGTL